MTDFIPDKLSGVALDYRPQITEIIEVESQFEVASTIDGMMARHSKKHTQQGDSIRGTVSVRASGMMKHGSVRLQQQMIKGAQSEIDSQIYL